MSLLSSATSSTSGVDALKTFLRKVKRRLVAAPIENATLTMCILALVVTLSWEILKGPILTVFMVYPQASKLTHVPIVHAFMIMVLHTSILKKK